MAITVQGDTFTGSVGTPWNIPAGVAVFVQPGSGGKVIDYDTTRQNYMSMYGVDPLGQVQPSQNASPGSANYEMSRTYYLNNPSQNFQDLSAQYQQQHGNALTFGMYSSSGISRQSTSEPTPVYDMSSAAGIAAYTARQGGTVTADTARIAFQEGYIGSLKAVSGMSTVLISEKADLAQGNALTIPAGVSPGSTVTTYVPYGSYAQTELLNTKDIINPISGEIGIYRLSEGGYYYKLIGGGGIGSLQSGMFTLGRPETSLVYTQESAGKVLAPSANATEASDILANESAYSRLGAEVYGGYVTKLTGATVESTGAQLSTYANQFNLANYVSPTGPNLSKADMNLFSLPWTISPNTSAVMAIGKGGNVTAVQLPAGVEETFTPSTQVAAIGPTTIQKSGATQESGGLTYTLLGTADNILGTTEQKATTPTTLFEGISSTIQNLPVLSNIYSLGAEYGASGKTAEVQSFITSTPVLSSIYKGGGVFELKSDYESLAASTYSAQSGNILKYTTDLNEYNTRLNAYNAELATYNTQPTIEGYNKLTLEQADLSRQLSTLTAQKASIDTAIAPVKSAETKYNAAASELIGNVDQSALATYGIGTAISDLGKEYTAIIETPVSSAVSGWGVVGGFISGIANVPTQITTIGESALIGGETILRNAGELPALATSGLAMQIKGAYDLAVTNPAYLIGSVAGMFALGTVASGAVTKGVNIVRTTGQTYVPIESIGYDVNEMYPIKPASATAENLIQSFEEGKLIPAPKEMYGGGEVPYLHGGGGIPIARLPSQTSPVTIGFTAHESPSLASGIKVGEAYQMTGTGSSELDAISMAPIAESYFAKVGGMIPKSIGISSPIKLPTIYSTEVSALETIPEYIKSQLSRNAEGKITDYTLINEYMQERLTNVPGGQGFVPLIKGEYEANIPTGGIFEVTGRQYYTKLGGFGESHFLGTRVPIIEQQLIGFEPIEATPSLQTRTAGESYYGEPEINVYTIIGSGETVALSTITPASDVYTMNRVLGYGGTDKTFAKESKAYSYVSIGGSSVLSGETSDQSTPSYSIPYTLPATESTVSTSEQSLASSVISPSESTIYSDIIYNPITPTYTPGISPPYTIMSPTTQITPPYTPTPIYPVTPIPTITTPLWFPSSPLSQPSDFPRRKPLRKYLEYFPVGLDISAFGIARGSNPFTSPAGERKYYPVESYGPHEESKTPRTYKPPVQRKAPKLKRTKTNIFF